MHSLLVVLAAALAPSLAAQTFVVDVNNGPGTDYTSFDAAISGVPDGAILTVRSGLYAEPPLAIVGKSLTIVCEPQVAVELPFPGSIRIAQLAANQSVVIRGLAVQSTWITTSVQITCEQNLGPVALDGLRPSTAARCHLVATDCDWLVVSDSRFYGTGTTLRNTRAVFEATAFGVSLVSYSFRQFGGEVQMNDCLVLGAPTIGSVGGAALELQGGDLRLLGYTTIAGGASLGVDGPCIEGTGTLRAEPSVSLDCPAPQTPATVPSTLAAMPRVTTDQPSPGAVTAALHGPVGHLGILGVGLPGPVVAIPGVRDPAFWLTPTAITQAIGVPMTSLPLASTTTIPNNPVFLGTVLVWHGFTYDASTGLQASNPSLHVVD